MSFNGNQFFEDPEFDYSISDCFFEKRQMRGCDQDCSIFNLEQKMEQQQIKPQNVEQKVVEVAESDPNEIIDLQAEQKNQAHQIPLNNEVQRENRQDEGVKQKKTRKKQSPRNKMSKVNNFGGFLIGTFACISNPNFKIQNGNYRIKKGDDWVFMANYEVALNEKQLVEALKKLKTSLEKLPRRQGSKKILKQILNENSNGDFIQEECKKLLRSEIVLALKNENWLRNHCQSRNFKPQKGEDLVAILKKRIQTYFRYLIEIRKGFEKDGNIPQRIQLEDLSN